MCNGSDLHGWIKVVFVLSSWGLLHFTRRVKLTKERMPKLPHMLLHTLHGEGTEYKWRSGHNIPVEPHNCTSPQHPSFAHTIRYYRKDAGWMTCLILGASIPIPNAIIVATIWSRTWGFVNSVSIVSLTPLSVVVVQMLQTGISSPSTCMQSWCLPLPKSTDALKNIINYFFYLNGQLANQFLHSVRCPLLLPQGLTGTLLIGTFLSTEACTIMILG